MQLKLTRRRRPPICAIIAGCRAPLAHAWLEQRTHNPLVPCSTHGGGTSTYKAFEKSKAFFLLRMPSTRYPGFEISDNASPAGLILPASAAKSPKETMPTKRLSEFTIGRRLI